MRYSFFTSCWVSVEPPWVPELRRLLTDGAADADRVEATVLVEAAVLGGEERVDDHRVHLVERDDEALTLLGQHRQLLAVLGDEHGRLQLRRIFRQVDREPEEREGGDAQRRRARRRPAAATAPTAARLAIAVAIRPPPARSFTAGLDYPTAGADQTAEVAIARTGNNER